jgi:hypothetical protein
MLAAGARALSRDKHYPMQTRAEWMFQAMVDEAKSGG